MKKLFSVLFLLPVIYTQAQTGIGTTSPNSTLDVRGSFSTPLTTFTANTTPGISDNMFIFTGTSAATLTLPTAVGISGREYWIKNVSSNSSVLTIATTSAQTIDGLSSWTLSQTNKAIRLVSNGTNWYAASESLPGSTGTPWVNGGNNVSSQQNIGTTSNYHLPFITNNTEKMRLTSTGSLGIGSSTFNGTYPERLLVDAGASGNTNFQNVIVGKGNTNSYAQLNIQNMSAGTSASSDVVATADNGNESTNYVDMGINSSTYAGGVMGGTNDAYIYNMGQDLLVGTGTAAKSLIFLTGGTSEATNERMRIDGNGNVGIGVTSPSYKLHINGTNPLFLNGVQTGASTDSILTIINGVVKKLHPAAIAAYSNAWSTLGNGSTNPSTNFIGTTDAQALVIRENNTQVGRFEANSIAFGNGATTNNSTHSYSIGSTATVGYNKSNAYAIGSNSAVNADSSFSIGNAAVTNGSNSFSIGNGANANNTSSVAIGYKAVTAYSITDALAIGTNATANSSNSIAIGSNAVLANKTTTNAADAIAIGTAAVANSASSIAIGTGSGTGYSISPAIAIGSAALVTGTNGVAIGNGATIGNISNGTSLGSGASVGGTGNNSTAVGYNASATLPNEIILGDRSNSSLSVGIGSESFSSTNREKLLVDAGTTTSVNAIVGKGSIDSYLQLNIQNMSAGASASSDVVATANNGTETNNYVDMGINGGSYSGGIMGTSNDAYLYNMGQNFLIGTGSVSKALLFMTGGTSQATNERMRITGTGNVGIANTAPSEKLDVTGNIRFSGALMPNNSAGTAGYFLQSMGSGSAPVWFDASAYAWLINGNTVSGLKSFGTINGYDLPFITNNTEKMRITSAGTVGIGTSAFSGSNPEELLVDAGATGNTNFQNVIVGKGNTNSYAQLNIQNINAGSSASSDVVATADNGNETTNYVDMGINSSTYAGGAMGSSNDAYLYNLGNNMLIGTGTAAKSLVFMTGGTSQASNERMRIDGNGNTGIGTNAPLSKLDVAGSAGYNIASTAAAITLDATHYTVILTGATVFAVTLPAASSTNTRRIYVIVNQGATARTITSYTGFAGTGVTALAAGSSITLQSNGTSWNRIQ